MTNPTDAFAAERHTAIAAMAEDAALQHTTREWFRQSCTYNYSYNFSWLGRPVIQYPQDLFAMQEIIWRVQPDLIIETGIAHGGSLIFYASLLQLLGNNGLVVGIDCEIRPHNRAAIEAHPMFHCIRLIEGSSTDPHIVAQVAAMAQDATCVLVALDSNHTHDHVLRELQLYSPLVTQGSYLVVFDTIVEDMPDDFAPDRPWGPGNNPKTAVHAFLQSCNRFAIDYEIEHKLLITVAPDGYLKCIRS